MKLHNYSRFLSIAVAFLGNLLFASKADLVVFSYDRPMQLYALLESVQQYVTGLESVTIIYRSSEQKYEDAYREVAGCFSTAQFLKQGDNPRQDFKPLTLQATFATPSNYVLFAVDDIIVTDYIDVERSIDLFEQEQAYGFYFRLGKHVSFCYSANQHQGVPASKHVAGDVFKWRFKDGRFDWNYPNTVDMTLYRKKDIRHSFDQLSYFSPNTLEAHWANEGIHFGSKKALFCEHAKMVNLPLNRVQNDCCNLHMNSYSPEQLLHLFNRGYKIDITPLHRVDNVSAHMPYEPTFIQRDDFQQHAINKHFVIVTASYNNSQWYKANLDSIFNQNYDNYHVIYVDDCSPDGTGELVEQYVQERGVQDRITLIKNMDRKLVMENQYHAITSCPDKAIVVILDGDDFFAHKNVLAYLNSVYQDNTTWLTYGQFIEYPSGSIGFCCPMPDDVVANNGFRYFSHIPSHLRTYYAGLFQKIKKEDLLYEGEFVKMTADIAQMFPMIEMAGQGHFKFIPHVLCIYNASNPLNEHKVSKELQRTLDLHLRSLPRYEPLTNLF